MNYLAYKEDGSFNGFYDDNFHTFEEIPKENIILISNKLKEYFLQEGKAIELKLDLVMDNKVYTTDDLDIFELNDIEPMPIPEDEEKKTLVKTILSLSINDKKKDLMIMNLVKTVSELSIKLAKKDVETNV